ncbi:hypothetical protein PP586_gp36 [Pseudoalteromonas phage vB_PspS-H40/1]|uniref:hypothetical protein n=1 Tax=Pseudoalteromonas phage vB_PspS-H40/1 TaxID=1856120 RepID=UPI0007DCFBA4|nr:hypothetical protein PP586_gp36 [Pseudoalteromonas phage vB_PspS-H40/1]ANI22053.1 hypothetical protein H401_36 [Pseudoalteromonas phage vB_PspS-H40/1]
MKLQVTKYLAIEITEPCELVELMSEEDKVEFMQSLSCHDSVFKHVADQIVNGFTVDGYHGGMTMVSDNPCTELQKAQRFVAKSVGEVHRREIEDLERAVKYHEEQANEWCEKYHSLNDKIAGSL